MTDAPVLTLDRVSRRYGGVTAVDQVSLQVARGEFFSLLGPSGCGKTTLLRLIAGFDNPEPDGGEIRLLGEVVNGRRPYQRPIGMVFQNYALFPHLTVAGNVAFGLEERRVPRSEIASRVTHVLELVRLDPALYANRRPTELSGGQRQRVALARALVLQPPVLLLDEPLGALDLQLRKEMQLELRQLNRTLGITFILVTHDQEEALVMSDRVAVMSGGKVIQVGTPAGIYDHPRTAFIAGFIGQANRFHGRVTAFADRVATVEQAANISWRVETSSAMAIGTSLEIAVRPEWHDLVRDGAAPPDCNAIPGTVREVIFLGDSSHVVVALTDGAIVRVAVRSAGLDSHADSWRVGEHVVVTWPVGSAQVLEQ